jgi:hypothetical protein
MVEAFGSIWNEIKDWKLMWRPTQDVPRLLAAGVFVFIDRVKIDVPCAGVDRMKTTSSYWPALDFCQGLTQHTFLPRKPLKRPVSALTFRSRGFLESARNAIPSNPTYKHDVKTTGDMKTTARSDQFPSF